MTEPRTEAGKRLLRGRSASGWDTGLHDAILAIEAEAAPPPLDGLDREKLAYSLRTHLCYGAITPEDKGIDVLIERYRSYTREKLAQMDGVIAALRDEGETT